MAVADILTQLKEFLLSSKTRSYSIIGTLMLLLLYGLEELIEKEIPCPCTSTGANSIYSGLLFGFPAGILLLISLLLHVETNQFYFICKISECCCCKKCYRCCFYSFKFVFLFIKLFIAPIVWVSMLYLDGDYYTCSVIMKSGKVDNITCAGFSCNRDSNSFLSGQQHHCDYSRFVGGLLLCTSLTCLLLSYFICYCFCRDENAYHYEYEYNCKYKNNETEIIIEKVTERAKGKVNEKLGNDISDKYPCIPKLTRINENDAFIPDEGLLPETSIVPVHGCCLNCCALSARLIQNLVSIIRIHCSYLQNDAAGSDQRQNSPSTPSSAELHSSDVPSGAMPPQQTHSGYSSTDQQEECVPLQSVEFSQSRGE